MNIIESLFEDKFLIDDRLADFSFDVAGYQIDFFATNSRFTAQVTLVKE
jgi:hypothetical protein